MDLGSLIIFFALWIHLYFEICLLRVGLLMVEQLCWKFQTRVFVVVILDDLLGSYTPELGWEFRFDMTHGSSIVTVLGAES